ncbi:hypothetical protein PCANC_07865 [Puccinia coronata f. sp. avenae]|uniref:Uncharacterized protein n=1 Tax=Puccinia coronata f. sp. avenae TaxID=200324 RepID=A0A2N5VCX0_9BASI|nr:hypothetical protein PCANC_07865 [Puccinia coronata f. sp. avenae]
MRLPVNTLGLLIQLGLIFDQARALPTEWSREVLQPSFSDSSRVIEDGVFHDFANALTENGKPDGYLSRDERVDQQPSSIIMESDHFNYGTKHQTMPETDSESWLASNLIPCMYPLHVPGFHEPSIYQLDSTDLQAENHNQLAATPAAGSSQNSLLPITSSYNNHVP